MASQQGIQEVLPETLSNKLMEIKSLTLALEKPESLKELDNCLTAIGRLCRDAQEIIEDNPSRIAGYFFRRLNKETVRLSELTGTMFSSNLGKQQVTNELRSLLRSGRIPGAMRHEHWYVTKESLVEYFRL